MIEPGALSGVVVADFAQLIQGPAATQVLGDLGANVIKIEPLGGDWLRHFALGEQFVNDESVSFLAFNRNKRSIALDLKNSEGRRAAKEIVKGADILVENFRPGVMERLGLSYEDVAPDNPGLIYCSGSGYGDQGPYRDLPGQDLLAQAVSGWTWLQGFADGPPQPTAVGVADLTAADHLVIGALAALHRRSVIGKGQRVSVSLLRSIMWLQAQELAVFMAGGPAPDETRSRSGIPNPYSGAPYGLYETSDGWVAVAMTQVNTLARLIGVSGLDHLNSNNVMKDRDEIRAVIGEALAKRDTEAWMNVFRENDVWAVPVQRYQQVVADAQVEANGIVVGVTHPVAGELTLVGPGVELSDTPPSLMHPPPALAEHTEEILTDVAGLTESEIRQMREGGAIL